MKKMLLFMPLLLIAQCMLLFALDFIVGIPMQTSIRNIINPFWVMDTEEYAIIIIIAGLCVAIPLYNKFRSVQKEKETT
ncbi:MULTISPECIES: hypothetical protein [Sutcliffiella]|uniref:hypothetical protein n=1 Tax=Sutcliffiella TaxID=2837511 RepID=UPI0022DE1B1D|nr:MULTISPECIES: hypothetical protein [Sutcliffiella]MED4015901.1 hypothetical protein [Sutcliffiella cohnii]WBL14961.1 hypothetical protein O1A01_24370 [Sutcliffiella sp. NC1]